MVEYLARGLQAQLQRRMSADSVVVLEGARATGKTRLLERGVEEGWIREVRSFANETERAAAEAAPRDYVNSLPTGTAIDEVQLFEAVTLAIKERIDADSLPGQFVLTGSTRMRRNALGGSDPLAGRAQAPLVLGPLTIGERAGTPIELLTQLFDDDPAEIVTGASLSRSALIESLAFPGLPGMVGLPPEQRDNRVDSYLTGVVSMQSFEARDVQKLVSLGRHVAASTSTLLNTKGFSQAVEIARPTTDKYLALLEEALLVRRLRGWRRSNEKSEIAKPKVHFFDSGVASVLGRLDPVGEPGDLGRLAETFVVGEFANQAMWVERPPELFHWRDGQKDEVDVVVEWADGRVVCVEVKSAEAVSLKDFRGIDAFRRRYPNEFHRGFVFYAGETVVPFGDERWAIPYSVLVPSEREAPLDPVGHILDRIAQARSEQTRDLDEQDRRILEISSETLRQFERIGESIGFRYELSSGDLAPRWGAQLIVNAPAGDVSFLSLTLDMLRNQISLATLKRANRHNRPLVLDLDDRRADDLLIELLQLAEPAMRDILRVWDTEARDPLS